MNNIDAAHSLTLNEDFARQKICFPCRHVDTEMDLLKIFTLEGLLQKLWMKRFPKYPGTCGRSSCPTKNGGLISLTALQYIRTYNQRGPEQESAKYCSMSDLRSQLTRHMSKEPISELVQGCGKQHTCYFPGSLRQCKMETFVHVDNKKINVQKTQNFIWINRFSKQIQGMLQYSSNIIILNI